MLSQPRMRLTCKTYLVRQSVCLELAKGKLEATILPIIQRDFDSDRGLRGRSGRGVRHGCSWPGVGQRKLMTNDSEGR